MKIKNATIKDFDTAYEYIKKIWDYKKYKNKKWIRGFSHCKSCSFTQSMVWYYSI